MKKPDPIANWKRTTQAEIARRFAACDPAYLAARDALAAAWDRPVADEEAAEHLAEAHVACASWRAEHGGARPIEWLLPHAEPWARLLLSLPVDPPAAAESNGRF